MVVIMFGVAGTGYNVVRRLAEDGKVRFPQHSRPRLPAPFHFSE